MKKKPKKEHKLKITKKLVIPFANNFNHITLQDLEEIMEWLNDSKFLSEDGKAFKSSFWSIFIKD